MIEAELFSIDQNADGRPWLPARTDGLVNHVVNCSNQIDDVRARALAWKESKLQSPRRS
ncbi:hypothetical protein EDB83DRAFT_2273088, partial [Lactarius deliciosus]